jgi:hypothetical protein
MFSFLMYKKKVNTDIFTDNVPHILSGFYAWCENHIPTAEKKSVSPQYLPLIHSFSIYFCPICIYLTLPV